MSANPQIREGDLQLSKPFSFVIPKPANKTLPHGKSEKPFDWITKVDHLARQEDAAANYTASCWYFAAALEPAIAYFGATNINTLHIEQFLAQNLFDNDRQPDALRLFSDILEKCAHVKADGKWNFRYETVAKSVIGCKCEYAQGFYGKRRFGRARGEFEGVLKISQNLLGANELTAKIQTKFGQASKKYAEALEAKSVLSDASKASSAKEGDKNKTGKIPSSPKVTVEKPIEGKGKPPASPGAAKEDKGKGNASPKGSQSPSREKGKESSPKKPPNDNSSSHKGGKESKDKPPTQPGAGKTGFQGPPKGTHTTSGHLQVPGKPRSSSVGGKPRKPEVNDSNQNSGSSSIHRRKSDAGISKRVVYGKTFDAEDSDGRLVRLDNLKWKEFNDSHKGVALWSPDRLFKTHDFLMNKCRNNVQYEEGNDSRKNRRRVRIAILDTGINMSHPEINARKDRVKGFLCQIKGLESKANEDTSGHGTSTALLLMQTAPEADIYIARVFRETKDVVPDQVAPAIEHAVNEWEVDIISMSFGFPSRLAKMDDALKLAANKNVLLFAAASNDGANEDITRAWPARDDSKVFCIHATDFKGWPWRGNPPNEVATFNFATLGENVLTAGKQDKMVGKTGTSMATPIAAATAALLIDFARVPRMKGKRIEHIDHVASFHGMRALLLASSTKIGEANFRYIKPWHLFSTNKFEYDSIGAAVQTELRKYFG